MEKYAYKPFKETYYKVDKIHFRIDDRFTSLIRNFEKCEDKQTDCNLEAEPKMKKFLKKRFIFISNK